MKRRELLRKLQHEGCFLVRSGSNHEIYVNPKTGIKQQVPRHSEIDEHLAGHILRYLGLEQ
ncbi:MAG: type II toxin-antitoxin system HicA family toxin [Pseudomonadota bacterium]